MYYCVMCIRADKSEKHLTCKDGFLESLFEAMAVRSSGISCAVDAYDADDEKRFRIVLY